MTLLELFSPYPDDIISEMREMVIDLLTPLAAHGVPAISLATIAEKLDEKDFGIEIDRPLLMLVLNPTILKLITKVDRDTVYFQIPSTLERSLPEDTRATEREKVKDRAQKQAVKNIQK